MCELEECWQYQLLVRRSRLVFSECHHIRSLEYCTEVAEEEILHARVLDEMVACKFFAAAKKAVCLKRQRLALKAGAPFSVLVDLGGSKSYICLSIHDSTTYFSRLGRMMVTFSMKNNTWHCPCAKPHMSCPHKNIAKWHIFQINRNLFRTQLDSKPDTASQSKQEQATEDLKRAVKYIYERKKIPASLPEDTTAKPPSDYPSDLIPAETSCVLCSSSPKFDMPVNITNMAKIVTTLGIAENISTYFKRCPECQMTYRYQEWQDGLHNFDDHLVLSLELCLYLRHSLQNHISVSRAIDTLQNLRKKQFPPTDRILHAYCHFEALTSTDCTYACVLCSYWPSVVVMDLHKKAVFNLAVSDLKDPPVSYTGEQSIVDFWDAINLEMISSGFVPSQAQNPCAVKPNYEFWAPWIGPMTRKSDKVLNTEHEKMSGVKSSTEVALTLVSEDRLVDELMKQKVSTVRKLCKACNVCFKGSHTDLVIRLREEMKTRQTYDKVFQKIWGASGGWSVIVCPHGIVYSLKFNLRAESPRDFADLLLSWKHFPNVCVYDFARGLATHTNLRLPAILPFHPFEGRVAQPTVENIQSAEMKKLQVSLPWLIESLEFPEPNGHPVTGSSEHYVLYDKFHEKNTLKTV
ncbi:HMG domain-containing protein 3-like isoform X4 [Brienomyrus brachyistius]|uniref:HMG domain-containing protein 3-like isoform X2 n=1 Tax=Brienomyrus brachyistius TaxID=42636 RepID=UPI0020B30F96|nr:HMG domain-containing protein 3-like isoform X2 [Brienomyrus brachyistius]XP_048867923.1 HMG domain-containing protein 3-like isoform X4 [Brienomyrus brachyistius]